MTQREVNGRFAKGSTGNPNGRPKKNRELRYYEITVSTCTYEDWKAIIDKAILQAKRGDHTARRWLADYIVGVPEQTQNVNIAGLPSVSEIVAELPSDGGGDS